jgi:ATP-dependent RNA helicase DOB1
MSDMFEGSIIRNVRRLDELINQLLVAAKNIGEVHLEQQLEEGAKLLRRGIGFAASLYL